MFGHLFGDSRWTHAVAAAGLTCLVAVADAVSRSVALSEGLGLTFIASPEWGRVTRPPSGTARYTLNYNTGAVTLVSGDGYAFNDGFAGEFEVTGPPSDNISYSMSIDAFSGSGVTVVASHVNGTSASGTGSLNGAGVYTLRLGGTLDISSNATLSLQTATVTVTVDNQ